MVAGGARVREGREDGGSEMSNKKCQLGGLMLFAVQYGDDIYVTCGEVLTVSICLNQRLQIALDRPVLASRCVRINRHRQFHLVQFLHAY